MCLCKGKGSVPIQEGSVIQFNACPDSHCTHDRARSEREWNQFKKEVQEMVNKERDLVGN